MRTALALAASLSLIAPTAAESDRRKHHRGCNTHACDRRIDREWARRHRPRGMRPAFVSVYGDGTDGQLGGQLACGGRLQAGTVEVANKALPCGTMVRLCYRQCVTAPVGDRGPYVDGREFDLSWATAQAIGFPDGIGEIRVRVERV